MTLPTSRTFEGQTPELLSPAAEAALALVMRRAAELAIKHGTFRRNCLTCAHFHEHAGEVCTYYQPVGRPPARVIADGCPAWEEKEPF